MKYENIKQAVARGVYTEIWYNSNHAANAAALFDAIAEKRPPRDSIQALADLAYDTVMQWDVRMVGKLRNLFPNYFPPSLSRGDLIAEYDEAGDWAVYKR